MVELLLESLCRICNIHEAKYTCPRCSSQTCSLPCARRHKIRASCNGIRDKTVFKPKSLLATPSGLDHDYNFLHSIEHRIERSERLIVEEKGLVDKEELKLARMGEYDRAMKRRKTGPQDAGEMPIQKSLQRTRTTIQRAPKGMRRNLENETNWNRKKKCINWQVEWIGDGSPRILSKVTAITPIGEACVVIMERERMKELTKEEIKAQNKRKAEEAKEGKSKRIKREAKESLDITTTPSLQDPETGAWSLTPTSSSIPEIHKLQPKPLPHKLYLLRPHTPASLPKVLVPLDPNEPLDVLLRARSVLEFPTIYIMDLGKLPSQYMLEEEFLSKVGQPPVLESEDTKIDGVTSSDEDGSATSTSGSDEDEDEDQDEEEGEIVPSIWA